ncbi:hypothetical protein STEG23_024905, partial [Scotinomys teguina]
EKIGMDVRILMRDNTVSKVVAGKLCKTTICSKVIQNGLLFKELLQTPNFRITMMGDADAVEACGALKNIVAMGTTFCNSLHCRNNSIVLVCEFFVLGISEGLVIKALNAMNLTLKITFIGFHNLGSSLLSLVFCWRGSGWVLSGRLLYDPDRCCLLEFQYSIVYMYHIFLIHSSVEGHLGCFQVLAITNNAAMNTVEHVSLCCYISNFISDFINLDALSLPFEKAPWGAEKKFEVCVYFSSWGFIAVELPIAFVFMGVSDFLRLGLFMVSQISWTFCVMTFLNLVFSLTDESISSIVSEVPVSE